jgi:hypothetical protein
MKEFKRLGVISGAFNLPSVWFFTCGDVDPLLTSAVTMQISPLHAQIEDTSFDETDCALRWDVMNAYISGGTDEAP